MVSPENSSGIRVHEFTPRIKSSGKIMSTVVDTEHHNGEIGDGQTVEKTPTLGKTIDRDTILQSKRQGLEKHDVSGYMAEISSSALWTSDELIICSRLLKKASESSSGPEAPVKFADERQMRRVFTLIYDVLRYKKILIEALNMIHFFEKHPEYKNEMYLVWLLSYDLYKRNFCQRDDKHLMENAWLEGSQVKPIDDYLWKHRVSLGASFARIRIKNNAIFLSNLLPRHLQDDRIGNTLSPFVSGWINYNKTDLKSIVESLLASGFEHLPLGQDVLKDKTYRMDHCLPLYIYIKPESKENFENSFLIRENYIVIQDRSFCLGAAMVQRIVKELSVKGSIVQTHVNTIRTTCYLANLLAIDDRKEKLLVFGSENKSELYEDYLRSLGVANVELYADNFSELPADTVLLENVVGVLATPPNTYYGVMDPVDLVCSRGGDLQLLKNLTGDHPQSADKESIEYINSLLQEQRKTLLVAMTKPQIQFIIYETHSQFEKENREMATQLLNELNAYANEKYGENEKKKVEQKVEETETALNSEQGTDGHKTEIGGQKQAEENVARPLNEPEFELEAEVKRKFSSENIAPDCDLFEFGPIPDLCEEHENCWKMEDAGLYIAFIKRKEIISLDPQYMIKFAEQRGLFSQVEAMKRQSTLPKRKLENEKSAEYLMEQQRSNSSSIHNLMKQQLGRIAAPTQSSILHSSISTEPKDLICRRYSSHPGTGLEPSESFLNLNDAKRWWKVAVKYVIKKLKNPKIFSRRTKEVPLKLARTKHLFRKMSTPFTTNRSLYPLHISSIKFQKHRSDFLMENSDLVSCLDLARAMDVSASVPKSASTRHTI